MNNLSFISNHPIWTAIVVIIIFLAFQIFIRPMFTKKKENTEVAQVIPKVANGIPEQNKVIADDKDTTKKRIKRGFGIMVDKIRTSDYIKNMQEANKSSENKETKITGKDATDYFDINLNDVTDVDKLDF